MNTQRQNNGRSPADFDSLSKLGELTHAELMAATSVARALAANGDAQAVRATRTYESELTRRFGGATTIGAPLQVELPPRKWWKPS